MKSVFIYGITGDIGSRVARLLMENGYTVSGVVRKDKDVVRLQNAGMDVIRGDIASCSSEEQSNWLRKMDIVLFTAGAHSEDETEIRKTDYEGVIKSALAAINAGIKSYVLVSAFPEAGRSRDTMPEFETYMFYKKMADAWLVKSEVPWTIIRPGRLIDTPASGKVAAAPALPYGDISRADFAHFIADVIAAGKYMNSIIEVTGDAK